MDTADLVTGVADPRASARLRALTHLPAAQQPPWDGHLDLSFIREELGVLPPLVDRREIGALRRALAQVEAGAAHLLHVGECAELFAMATPGCIARRLSLYQRIADRLSARTGRPVVLVARMAGQHAKPRSEPFDILPGGTRLPVYRGDAVNSTEAVHAERRADPWRLLTSYDMSRDTMDYLRSRPAGSPLFVSHEALLRDYEEPMTRMDDDLYSGSGHLLWVGERTRLPGDWHVQWASAIANPVAVKIGPTAAGHDVTELVRTLNPHRERGRLSLIARMGAANAAGRLGSLIAAVAEVRTPALWQCDPMHGNTRKVNGTKLRLLPDLRAEVTAFVRTMREHGCHPGGLHLEVTPENLSECHEEVPAAPAPAGRFPCDPRLNQPQALEIVEHFADELAAR